MFNFMEQSQLFIRDGLVFKLWFKSQNSGYLPTENAYSNIPLTIQVSHWAHFWFTNSNLVNNISYFSDIVIWNSVVMIHNHLVPQKAISGVTSWAWSLTNTKIKTVPDDSTVYRDCFLKVKYESPASIMHPLSWQNNTTTLEMAFTREFTTVLSTLKDAIRMWPCIKDSTRPHQTV